MYRYVIRSLSTYIDTNLVPRLNHLSQIITSVASVSRETNIQRSDTLKILIIGNSTSSVHYSVISSLSKYMYEHISESYEYEIHCETVSDIDQPPLDLVDTQQTEFIFPFSSLTPPHLNPLINSKTIFDLVVLTTPNTSLSHRPLSLLSRLASTSSPSAPLLYLSSWSDYEALRDDIIKHDSYNESVCYETNGFTTPTSTRVLDKDEITSVEKDKTSTQEIFAFWLHKIEQ